MTEQEQIDAAHPMNTGRHGLYAEAMRLVGERHAKYDLVDLVNWLLAGPEVLQAEVERLTAENAELKQRLDRAYGVEKITLRECSDAIGCTCLIDDSLGMASKDPACPVHGEN